MTTIYLKARQGAIISQIIDELLLDGIALDQMRVHAAHKLHKGEFAVACVRHRSLARALGEGAAMGALFATPVVVAALLAGAAMLALPVILLGAGIGGIFAALHARLLDKEIAPQANALDRGALLLAIEVAHANVGAIQDRIKERHPEVIVLGADPAGTPPFPSA